MKCMETGVIASDWQILTTSPRPYWLTHQQPKGGWSNEVEIRPHTEDWTF